MDDLEKVWQSVLASWIDLEREGDNDLSSKHHITLGSLLQLKRDIWNSIFRSKQDGREITYNDPFHIAKSDSNSIKIPFSQLVSLISNGTYFLKPGMFILCVYTVKQLSHRYDGENVELGSGLLMLVKDEEKFCFVFVPDDETENSYNELHHRIWSTFEKIEQTSCSIIKIGRRNWINVNESVVTMYLEESLFTVQFTYETDALICQTDICDYLKTTFKQNMVCIYGKCALDQLKHYDFQRGNFASTTISENISSYQHYIVSTTTPTPYDRCQSKEKPAVKTVCPCERIHLYLRRMDMHIFVMLPGSLCFDIEKTIEEDFDNKLKDLSTLRTIVPFCGRREELKDHWSPQNLMNDIANFSALLNAGQRLHSCSNIYRRYKEKAIEVKTHVERLFPYSNENVAQAIGFGNGELSELFQKVRRDQQNNTTHSNYLKVINDQPTFDLICRLCQDMSRPDCDFALFDNLDKVLRTGSKENLFDHLSNNLRVDFQVLEEEIQNLITFCENIFPEESILVLETNIEDNWELQSVLDPFRRIDKERISEITPIISTKISNCMVNLQVIFDSVQEYLNFNIADWNTVWEIRHRMAPDMICSRINNSPISTSIQPGETTTPLSQKPTGNQWNCDNWKRIRRYLTNELEKLAYIAHGAYGSVSQYQHRFLGRVVVKEFHPKTSDGEVKKEIEMLIDLQRNANIVRLRGILYETEENSRPVGVLMEYIESNLHEFIHAKARDSFKNRYTLKKALKVSLALANAFGALHYLRIIHRDIKPANILITSRRRIQICDVGTSTNLLMTVKSGEIGTLLYMSPEMMESKDYDFKTDVYSLGITIWEIFHRREPFHNINTNGAIMDLVIEGKRPEIDTAKYPPHVASVITGAWDHNSSNRKTMYELEEMLTRLLNSLPRLKLEEEIG